MGDFLFKFRKDPSWPNVKIHLYNIRFFYAFTPLDIFPLLLCIYNEVSVHPFFVGPSSPCCVEPVCGLNSSWAC